MSKKEKKQWTAAQVIRERRLSLNTKQEYKSLFLRLVAIVLIGYLVFTEVFLITQSSGLGMFPAVKDGDLILAYRLQEEYAKKDVIVYTVNGKQEIGRIVGRETDVINIDTSGTLRVNGTVQTGEILYPTHSRDGLEYQEVVPEGHVYILGDYRTNTKDSRDYGSIPIESVEGKIITILRRRGL